MDNEQKIKAIKEYFNKLEKVGCEFQERGRYFVKIAKEGKFVVDKIGWLFESAQGQEKDHWLLDNLYSQTYSAKIPTSPKTLYPSVVSASTVTAQAYVISTVEDLPGAREQESVRLELDGYLTLCRKEYGIVEDFVQQRQGAWSVFYSDSKKAGDTYRNPNQLRFRYVSPGLKPGNG